MQTQIRSRARTHPALVQIGVERLYQQVLFDMVSDLEKGFPSAVEWFTNDLENVGLVATAAGFDPDAVFRLISWPLIAGVPLNVVVAEIGKLKLAGLVAA